MIERLSPQGICLHSSRPPASRPQPNRKFLVFQIPGAKPRLTSLGSRLLHHSIGSTFRIHRLARTGSSRGPEGGAPPELQVHIHVSSGGPRSDGASPAPQMSPASASWVSQRAARAPSGWNLSHLSPTGILVACRIRPARPSSSQPPLLGPTHSPPGPACHGGLSKGRSRDSGPPLCKAAY